MTDSTHPPSALLPISLASEEKNKQTNKTLDHLKKRIAQVSFWEGYSFDHYYHNGWCEFFGRGLRRSIVAWKKRKPVIHRQLAQPLAPFVNSRLRCLMAICGHLFLMTRRKSLFGSNQDYIYSGDKEDCRENGHWWTSNRLFAETQSNRKNPRISLSCFPPNLSRYRRRIVRCRSLVLKYAIISQSTLMTYRLHLSLSLLLSTLHE